MAKNKIIEPILITVIFAIILYLFSFFSLNIDFLDPVENTIADIELTDLYFSVFKEKKKEIDTNIVLVNFGDLGRAKIANTVEIIKNYNPKVIGVDAYFYSALEKSSDSSISKIFSSTKNLVLVSILTNDSVNKFNDSSTLLRKSFFSTNIEQGYANLKEDGAFRTIRNFRPFIEINNYAVPAFATKIVELYSTTSYWKLLKRDNKEETINYIGNQRKFFNLQANNILSGKQSLDFLRNKIVLLGYIGKQHNKTISRDYEDRFFTPLNSKYVGRGEPDMFGVVIHANIISMILKNDYITTLSTPSKYGIILLLIFINTLFFLKLYNNNHDLYSSFSKVIIIFESVILLFLTFAIIHYFNFKIELKPILLSLIFLPDIIESYKGIKKKIKRET